MNKELEPLQALEKVKMAEVDIGGGCSIRFYHTKQYSIIENALKDYENTKARLDDTQALLWENQKKLKALEIIKKHTELTIWGEFIWHSYKDTLTPEEYELLKEVLL